ncbi:tetratricopeptide repeat protein [Mucilaginibacter angelicae]|uniref:Tetratricopeptide repeat protein n=1 Tax=Mucilaginibacter angelicae TaxID=869718 RepID=A0ABV6L4A1_9SPHI
MKNNIRLIKSIFALTIVFFTAQSFYYRYQKNTSTSSAFLYKGTVKRAVVCGFVYNGADSIPDIPALKGWGNYQWKITTTSDSAQFYFNQGISMYYAFHSIEAIASFIKATRFDPECAMAWYGKSLAMGPTINYPNGYAPPADAYEASEKSKKLSPNCTPLEKELITAMQQRYSKDSTVTVKQLRTNYADAMQVVYLKHPKNAEVLTLYADALLLLHPWDLYTHDFKPKPWTPQIRSLLEQAIAIYPKHPGANHFYIHTMEASATPQMALKSAHLLDTLMPQVSHITHMPSHIYIRTGNYEQGITNNTAAVAGFNNYLKQYSPVVNGDILYKIHNIHLKVNCAQMAGNYQTALSAAYDVRATITPYYLGAKGADGNFFQYVYMQPVLTAVRFGKWADILNIKPVDTLVYASVLLHFSKGLAWCSKDNATNARHELKLLETKMQDPSLKAPIDNFSSAYESAGVARLILQGCIAAAEKKHNAAINILQKAVTAEDNLIYNEPRDWPLPARHYLGNALLKAGRYNEAIAVLNKDLVINPNNGWALTGLQLAYQNTSNTIALNKVKQQLKTAWKIKDIAIDKPVF